jgi:hypothetical protein
MLGGATKKGKLEIKGAGKKEGSDLHRFDNFASSVGILELSGEEFNCRATIDFW